MERTEKKYLCVRNARGLFGEPLSVLVCREGSGEAFIQKISGEETVRLPADTKTFDAEGGVILPAFTDLCGFPDRQKSARALSDETASALCGGYIRTVSCDPSPDAAVYSERCRRAADSARTEVLFAGEMKDGSDLSGLTQAGARIFTDLPSARCGTRFLLSALSSLPEDAVILLSCRDPEGETGFHDGAAAKRLRLPGTSPVAEELAVQRALTLSAVTGRKIHITGITTARALQRVREAKYGGGNVTCDVPVYSFSFTESDLFYYGASAKLSPPLRTEADREAVRQALADGTADAVTTFHFPCSDREKNGLKDAVSGAVGYQTAFAAVMTGLVQPGLIPMRRAAELLSLNPAAILGYDAELKEKGRADFVLTDPGREWVVTPGLLRGRSTHTPFLGGSLTGAVLHTVRNGEWL
ncbi:MAG: hypothetical protein MJ070_08820 [Lachnospiraceae bacterium]|nr:hypothetical protein [Lachnospiraceae bacterium]